MKDITVYIVPAWSDQGGRCRIYKKDALVDNARDDYRSNPDQWVEVGIMNSHGHLVCLELPKPAMDSIAADSPLAAGMSWKFKAQELEGAV